MIGEHKVCSTCVYHSRMLIRRDGEMKHIYVCDNNDSFYDGIETSYKSTCDVWAPRRGDDR